MREDTDAELEAWARKEHPSFWQAAYRAGALAMRERAAELAAEHIASESSIVGLVQAIRALGVE